MNARVKMESPIQQILVSRWNNEFLEVLSHILFFRDGRQKAGCVLDKPDSCNNRRDLSRLVKKLSKQKLSVNPICQLTTTRTPETRSCVMQMKRTLDSSVMVSSSAA